jgi:hypothetical protein
MMCVFFHISRCRHFLKTKISLANSKTFCRRSQARLPRAVSSLFAPIHPMVRVHQAQCGRMKLRRRLLAYQKVPRPLRADENESSRKSFQNRLRLHEWHKYYEIEAGLPLSKDSRKCPCVTRPAAKSQVQSPTFTSYQTPPSPLPGPSHYNEQSVSQFGHTIQGHHVAQAGPSTGQSLGTTPHQ